MLSLVELYCAVDDFWQGFEKKWTTFLVKSGEQQRQRRGRLKASEIMTLVIHFHQAGYRNFKKYYLGYVCQYLRGEFPELVSYNRFVELMERVMVPLLAYLWSRCGKSHGVAFIDSTSLVVSDPHRIHQHKVFAGKAARGKTSTGWFYGFKLHLLINDQGELIAFALTPGNVSDLTLAPTLAAFIHGKLLGDKGYQSQKLVAQLLTQGVHLITKLKRNTKHTPLMPYEDRVFLRHRALIETVIDQLKNISQIEHSRHRSFTNFLVNLWAGLIAYTWQPTKPALRFQHDLALSA